MSRCNCENLHCPTCKGNGCTKPAGARKFVYVGHLCDDCAPHLPEKYEIIQGQSVRVRKLTTRPE